MKKNILYIMTACAAMTLGLSSCHDDPSIVKPVDGGEGQINLAALSIDTSDAEKVVNSTAGRAADIDINDFIVTITNKDDESFVRTWRYAEMPEVVTLPVGDNYVVSVESHKVQKAEWEKPYFRGSEEFSVAAGEITTVGTVTARFSSLKVTIVFDESLKAIVDNDANVTVSANDEGQLTYTRSDIDAARAGYFEVVENSMTMIAHFEGKIGGVATTYDTPFTTVEAGQHHIITYKAKSLPPIPDQTGQIDPDGIRVEATVQVINIASGIVVEEEVLDPVDDPNHEVLPDNPDNPTPPGPDIPDIPDEDAAATFEASESPNLDLNGRNQVTAAFGNAKVLIKCPKGISNLFVNIATTDVDFRETLEGGGMLSFDLCYPGDAELSITDLGLPVNDEVRNKTEILFDISDFVPLLVNFPGEHTFTITVRDNDNAEATQTLIFFVN